MKKIILAISAIFIIAQVFIISYTFISININSLDYNQNISLNEGIYLNKEQKTILYLYEINEHEIEELNNINSFILDNTDKTKYYKFTLTIDKKDIYLKNLTFKYHFKDYIFEGSNNNLFILSLYKDIVASINIKYNDNLYNLSIIR